MESNDLKTALEAIADMAEYANGVAALACGHRKILSEGGFPNELCDHMAMALHAQMLGLAPVWEEEEPEFQLLEIHVERDDEEDV